MDSEWGTKMSEQSVIQRVNIYGEASSMLEGPEDLNPKSRPYLLVDELPNEAKWCSVRGLGLYLAAL